MHIVRVRMPQMGSSVHESTVVEWRKGVGEAVVRGEVLIAAESDKVDFEIEAPANGVLKEIKVNAEETIPVGEVLGLIETEEEVAEEAPSPPSSKDGGLPEKAGGEDWVAPVAPMTRRERPAPAPKAAAPPKPPPRPEAEGTHFPVLSPRVQRLAAENGLSMEQVSRISGTGAGGRITAKDVKKFVASGGAAPAASLASLTGIGEGAADGLQLHFRPLSEADPDGVRERKEPFNRIRKRIAENLSRSAREIPQVTAHTEVDMTRISAWREANKEAFERAHGVRLTYTPFFALGIIAAVRERENARFNAALEKDVLTVKRYVNLGIAVDTPGGLVVPVLHGADGLSFAGLVRGIDDLAARARGGGLTPDEARGATITLTNTGSTGTLLANPLLNPPEVAIAGTGAIVHRVVALADNATAVRLIMILSLTFDHRANDGLAAGRFSGAIRAALERMDLSRLKD